MHAEMDSIQPLMHLLSTYVIKPIAFDANPYVLPRAAQFVKYGGANKYFQKHGNKPSGSGASGSFMNMDEGGAGSGQFNRRPFTQQKSDRKNSEVVEEGFDDFETVDDKPKKPVR